MKLPSLAVPQLVLEPTRGIAAVEDQLAHAALFTGIALAPARVARMKSLPHPGELAGTTHALVFVRPEAQASLTFRAGFAWAADGDITEPGAWKSHLQRTAAPLP